MSAFVRFEPGELLFTEGNGWEPNEAPWICPVRDIAPIEAERITWDVGGEGGAAEGIPVYMSGPRGSAGMPVLWTGTGEALFERLNGGPLQPEALSTVLQRALVALDAEQERTAPAVGPGEPLGLAWFHNPRDPAATTDQCDWTYQDGHCCLRRIGHDGPHHSPHIGAADPAAGMSLEEAIEAGHAVLEREAGCTHLTWIRGGWEQTIPIDEYGVEWARHLRGVWPTVDRATLQHEEPELWERAVAAWVARPEWPVGQEGAA